MCRDRTLATGGKLYAWLAAQPAQGGYCVDVPARPGQRSAHRATLEVRFGRIAIKRPASCSDKQALKHIELSVVEVKELPDSVVGDEAPIHWRLLITKKQGLDVEGSQVETGEDLTKLLCLAIQAAVRTMQLTLACDTDSATQAAEVFDAGEIEIVQKILPTLEGKTQKQKNPHWPGSLAQAAWVVARLGGWKGYASEAKPGPITMLRGLQRIEALCEGWKLAMRDVCID